MDDAGGWNFRQQKIMRWEKLGYLAVRDRVWVFLRRQFPYETHRMGVCDAATAGLMDLLASIGALNLIQMGIDAENESDAEERDARRKPPTERGTK